MAAGQSARWSCEASPETSPRNSCICYETDQRNIEMLHNAGFELPSALRLIAEFTLARRFEDELRQAQGSHDPAFYDNAAAIAEEIARRRYRMDKTTPNLLVSE